MDKETVMQIRFIETLFYNSKQYKAFKKKLNKEFPELESHFFPLEIWDITDTLLTNYQTIKIPYSEYLIAHELVELLKNDRIGYVMVNPGLHYAIHEYPEKNVLLKEHSYDELDKMIKGDFVYFIQLYKNYMRLEKKDMNNMIEQLMIRRLYPNVTPKR